MNHQHVSINADVYDELRAALPVRTKMSPFIEGLIRSYLDSPQAAQGEPRDLAGDGWIQTIKGNPFYLFEPRPGDFDIEEIAHALSMQNRFNGHTPFPYSVAQHSVLVSCLLESWGEPREVALCGLLHDAAEAYVGDVVRPLKLALPGYKLIEKRIERALAEQFRIPFPFPPVIKRADNAMLLAEKNCLLEESPRPWKETGFESDAPGDCIRERSWIQARETFIKRFHDLTEPSR